MDTQTTPTIALGETIIVDGRTHTVETFIGETARAVHTESTIAVRFAVRDAVRLGPGLWGLPGRIEAPKVNPQASVVASPAVAAAGTPPLGAPL